MRIVSLIIIFCVLIISSAFSKQTMDLDSIIINSSRTNDLLGKMNKSISVITSEDIENAPAKSLPEILGVEAGVHGIKFGNIKNAQVDLGGYGETALSNTLILVDGRRTNQIDLSGQDWSQVDLKLVDHIEIIKGSGAVLYGDNATGGVINIVTKKGTKDKKPTVTLFNEFGSYQTQKHGLNVGGGFKTLDYQVNYAHQESGGFRAQSNYWANDSSINLGFDPTEDFGIDFSQGYHLDRYQLPGALFLDSIALYGRSGVRPGQNNDHGWTSDSHFDVTPHYRFNAGASEGELSLFISERKRINKFFTGSTVYETAYETNSYEFQPKLILSTPLSERLVNKLTVGYDEFYAKNRRRSGNLGPTEDLVFIRKATHEVYTLEELTVDEKWLLNTGIRGSWADYSFHQIEQIAFKSSRSATLQAYEGGVGYKYNPTSKVYINFSRSYRLPAVDEFFQNLYDFGGGFSGGGLNTALTAQKGKEIQFGIKDTTLRNTKLGISFSLVHNKNEIYYDSSLSTNTNYNGKTRHYAAALEAAHEFWEGKLEPFINLTFQKGEFLKGSYNGNEIPFVPNQMANAGLTWRPIERLSTSLTVNQVGKSFAISDAANTHAKLKRYATADWNFKYGIKNFDVWFSLNNILNSKYSSYGVLNPFAHGGSGDIGYYPASGRNVNAGVEMKF